jgi:hypothetical protein
MKKGKAVLLGVFVIIVVIGVATWQIFTNLDAIVASVIENVGTEVMQTPVKVKTVNLELKAGKVGISGMTIKNLAGYSDPYVFSMDDIAVDIDVSSLGKNPLVIEELLIRQPKVFAEVNKEGVSNLEILSKNIESSSSSKEKKQEPAATDESGEELKLIIKKFRFEGGNLKASSQVNPDKKIDQTLPVISMDNLGAKTGGANGQEIATEMMKILIAQTTQAVLKAGLNKAVEKEKKKLMDKASDKFRGIFGN